MTLENYKMINRGKYLHRRIKIYVQDPIVMKKDDNRSKKFFQISCHTKFRFAEREAQCILGECGPLKSIIELTDSWEKCPGIGNRIRAVSLTIAQTFPLR